MPQTPSPARLREMADTLTLWAEDDVLGSRRDLQNAAMFSQQFIEARDLEKWAGLMLEAAEMLRALAAAPAQGAIKDGSR